MKRLVEATYSQIPRGSIEDTAHFVDRIVRAELPAFIIANTGNSLREALMRTEIDTLLRTHGYDGNVRNSVDFVHKAGVLPLDLSGMPYLSGEQWAQMGVTSLHTDKHESDQAQQFSLNHTKAGSSEVRLHASRLTPEQLDDQWDLLDTLTGDILWRSVVDPDLVAPEGQKAIIVPGDLLVFDPSNAHVVRSLETPRISEATFFDKQY